MKLENEEFSGMMKKHIKKSCRVLPGGGEAIMTNIWHYWTATFGYSYRRHKMVLFTILDTFIIISYN
jgi:hypothetical protein